MLGAGRFDLVIFDCDGVLIDSEPISARILIEALSALQVSVDMAYVSAHFVGRSFPTVAKMIAERFRVTLPKNFERRYRADLLLAFEGELQATEGIVDLLARLQMAKCVATSSSPQRAARSLEIVGLTEYFGRNVFTASEVAHGKPAPDLFLHAAAQMGAMPARCLVIEDSLIGVEAARAAGMQVARYVGGGHLRGGEPDISMDGPQVQAFSCWEDFEQVLAGLPQPILRE